jgi:TPP-dependent pyruvate/acetoin dehydrogenase alpha subunit
MLDDVDLHRLEQEVAAEINEAVAFAEAGAWEPVEDLERFVYSERSSP